MSLGFTPEAGTPETPTEDLGVPPFGSVITGMAGITTSTVATIAPITVTTSMAPVGHMTYTLSVAKSMSYDGKLFVISLYDMADTLSAISTAATGGAVNVTESMSIASTTSRHLVALTNVLQSINETDKAFRIIENSIELSAGISSSVVEVLIKTANVHELANVAANAVSVLTAIVSLSTSATVLDSMQSIQDDFIDTTAVLADTLSTWAHMSATLNEAYQVAPSVTGGATLALFIAEQAAFAEVTTLSGVFSAILNDGVSAYMSFNIGGEVFTCWVTNAANLASSEYRQFDFNSLCVVDGKYYASGNDGVYLLEGGTDAGEPIQASVLTGLMDFGSPALKHVPGGYISRSANGDMLATIVTATDGRKRVDSYIITNTLSDTFRTTHFLFGKGLRAKYWQLELSNVDGADFEVDQVELSPAALLRRV